MRGCGQYSCARAVAAAVVVMAEAYKLLRGKGQGNAGGLRVGSCEATGFLAQVRGEYKKVGRGEGPSDSEKSGYLAETEVSESGRRVGQQGGDSAKFGVGGGCSCWGLGTERGANCLALSGRRRSDAKVPGRCPGLICGCPFGAGGAAGRGSVGWEGG